jgi:hypothetical protein
MKKWDGYDEAIIGPAMVWHKKGHTEVLVYNAESIRNILMSRDTPILVWPNDMYRVTDHDTEH